MPEKIIEIILALLILILSFGLVYFTMTYLIRRNLRLLQKEFGGSLKPKIFGADYSLDGITLHYAIKSPYSAGGSIFRVEKTPIGPIKTYISAKKRFCSIENTFKKAFSPDVIELNKYKTLFDEIEKFKAEMQSNKSSLSINPNEFFLSTEYSPFHYGKLKNCLKRLLKIKKIINHEDRASGFSPL